METLALCALCGLLTITLVFAVVAALVLPKLLRSLPAHPRVRQLGGAFRHAFGAVEESEGYVGSVDGHRVRLSRVKQRYSAAEMCVHVDVPTGNNVLIVHPSVRDPVMIAVGVMKVVDVELPDGFTALARMPADAKERLARPDAREALEALIALPGTSRIHLLPSGLGQSGARWEGRFVPELHEEQFVAAALKLIDLARAVA